MRNYIILNGNNSNTISGLLIQSLPPISKPLMRTAIEEIDGRDGDIVTNLGYSAYDKEVSIGLYGSYDVDEVIKYFNDNMTGQVTFSNEPDKYYNYEIINQIDFERLIRFKTAIVTLHCQPFKYPTEETPVEINIQNITNEAEEMDLDNTADAPMTLALKGNTSQASEPTPDSPVDVNVVSGDNTIEICGKNLFNKETVLRNKTFTSANVVNDSTGLFISDYIKVQPSTAYYTNENAPVVIGLDKDKNSLGYIRNASQAGSFTTQANCEYIRIRSYNTTIPMETAIASAMITKGDTAPTQYEAYTGNSQLISLGVENLLNLTDRTTTLNGITATITNNEIVLNGTASAYTEIYVSLTAKTLSTGNYTLSINEISGSVSGNSGGNTLYNTLRTSSYTTINSIAYGVSTSNTRNFTSETTLGDLRISLSSGVKCTNYTYNLQLEKGSKANSYSEYGKEPIELCKIGTYQDYIYKDNDRWFLHKEIGKVVLNGTENWYNASSVATGTSRFYYDDDFYNDGDGNSSTVYAMSNMFKGLGWRQIYTSDTTTKNAVANYCGQTTKRLHIRIDNNYASDVPTFKTWLSTNKPIVYYVLATPTDTEITDSTLISQLNNLANARSYDTSTHITQNANDKPFILNATAVQKGTDTGIVDNDGNIYSKPTLDIEGNGIVAIYLNGNQMFSVDLSNSSECIIDVTNLEAYDPETNELMNRQVTGDYSNFTLPVGENQVKVSGNVTKTTISDYVRWL